MTIKEIGFFLCSLLLAGCTVKWEYVAPQTSITPGPTVPGTLPELQVRTTTGEWIAANGGSGGINNFSTFKNYQYTLEVAKNNQQLDIALASADIDVQYALFNPLGQQIGASSVSRSSVNSFTVNAGTYRVVACAARQAVGKFTLTVVGVNSDPARIASQTLQSNTQNWGPLGGGGFIKSTKNHFYNFDVTDDNTTIDVEIESADTETSLVLYDGLDVVVGRQSGNRYLFDLTAAKKVTYTVMAATANRGAVGNYKLRVFGKVANLTPVQSVSSAASGNWPSGTAFDTYSFEIGANSAPIDIDLTSPDIDVQISLLTGAGVSLSKTCCPVKSASLTTENLPKGTYQIMVQSYQSATRRGAGNYTMNVFGRYTNFKKL